MSESLCRPHAATVTFHVDGEHLIPHQSQLPLYMLRETLIRPLNTKLLDQLGRKAVSGIHLFQLQPRRFGFCLLHLLLVFVLVQAVQERDASYAEERVEDVCDVIRSVGYASVLRILGSKPHSAEAGPFTSERIDSPAH